MFRSWMGARNVQASEIVKKLDVTPGCHRRRNVYKGPWFHFFCCSYPSFALQPRRSSNFGGLFRCRSVLPLLRLVLVSPSIYFILHLPGKRCICGFFFLFLSLFSSLSRGFIHWTTGTSLVPSVNVITVRYHGCLSHRPLNFIGQIWTLVRMIHLESSKQHLERSK